MDSTQNSMAFPTNTKFLFNNDGFGGGVGTGFIDSGGTLFTTPPPLSDNQGFVNDDNIGQSSSSGSSNGNSGPSPTGAELDIKLDVEKDPLVRGNIQTIDVIVSDENTREKIANANTDLKVFYTTDFDKVESGQTNNDGVATFEIEIGPGSNTGKFDVTAIVDAAGYATETDRTTFEVIEEPDDTNETSSQNNTTDSDNNNRTSTNDSEEETNGNTNQNEDAEIQPLIDQEQQEPEEQNENSNNEGDSGEDGSRDNSNSDEVSNEPNDSNSDDSGGSEN